MSSQSSPAQTLYDTPVSNNGARCRLILYKLQIPSHQVAIVSPAELGGLKSPEYLKLNPQGKMPLLVDHTASANELSVIPESDTIARFLVDRYAGANKNAFQLSNPRSNLICRLHDTYLTPIQSAMYKGPPFAGFGTKRMDALHEYVKQLAIIEDLILAPGKYLCGEEEISLADVTLFPTCVFADYMLPKFDISPSLPTKIAAWYQNLKESDKDFQKVYEEIHDALVGWEERKRWDHLFGAGYRDMDPPTLFDKIVSKEIPATVVREDDKVIAFADINPAAPGHILVIPKERMGLTRLSNAKNDEHQDILGRLLAVAADILNDKELGFRNGGRVVINDGAEDAGQEVSHLHLHVLGGRKFSWPPG